MEWPGLRASAGSRQVLPALSSLLQSDSLWIGFPMVPHSWPLGCCRSLLLAAYFCLSVSPSRNLHRATGPHLRWKAPPSQVELDVHTVQPVGDRRVAQLRING